MPEYGRLRQPGRLSRRSSLVLSGGSEGVNGKYKYHIFTSSGSLVVASVGEPVFLECLLVGGGGSGGGTGGAGGGGGGGGVLLDVGFVPAVGSYTVTVGAGGAATSGSNNGGDSSIVGTNITRLKAYGGGGGGYYNIVAPKVGGSGGGAGGTPTSVPILGG